MPELNEFPGDTSGLLNKLAEQVKEAFEQNSKICLDALTNYTSEKWMDWIEDQLNYNIAHPTFPSFDSVRYDDIVELFLHFEMQKISAVNYQTALMKTLQGLIDELRIKPGDKLLKEKCKRLANALMGSKEPVQNTQLLLQMYLNPLNDAVIIEDDDIVLKAYLLQIFSRAPLLKEQLEKIFELGMNYVLTEKFDPIYLSGVLRIAWRQYTAKRFFEVFITIMKSITKRGLFCQRVIVNMVDVIHSVAFYKNSEFRECFDEFMVQLKLVKGIDELITYIETDEALINYRAGKID